MRSNLSYFFKKKSLICPDCCADSDINTILENYIDIRLKYQGLPHDLGYYFNRDELCFIKDNKVYRQELNDLFPARIFSLKQFEAIIYNIQTKFGKITFSSISFERHCPVSQHYPDLCDFHHIVYITEINTEAKKAILLKEVIIFSDFEVNNGCNGETNLLLGSISDREMIHINSWQHINSTDYKTIKQLTTKIRLIK